MSNIETAILAASAKGFQSTRKLLAKHGPAAIPAMEAIMGAHSTTRMRVYGTAGGIGPCVQRA